MKLTTTTRRLAAAGAAAAMAAGALVGATTTAASAAEVTTEYTCELQAFGLGPWTVTVASNAVGIDGIPGLPAGYDANDPIPVTNHFTIPDDAYQNLVGYGVEDVSFPDYAGDFGGNPVPVANMTAKVSEMTDNGDGTHSFDSDGATSPFEAPAAGVHDVTAPSAFALSAFVPAANGEVAFPCVLSEGAAAGVYATIPVVKNDSVTNGSAKPVSKGSVSKVKIDVGAFNETPSGKVVVKKGSKKLGAAKLNKKGKAVFKKKFGKGKTKLTLIYKGDGYTNGSKTAEPVIVKVTR